MSKRSTELALARAQAYNISLTRHIHALKETICKHGVPTANDMVVACDQILLNALQDSQAVGQQSAHIH